MKFLFIIVNTILFLNSAIVLGAEGNPFKAYAGTYKVLSEHLYRVSNSGVKVDKDFNPVETKRIQIATDIGDDKTGTNFSFLDSDTEKSGWTRGMWPHISNAYPGGDRAYYESGSNSAKGHTYMRFLAGCPDSDTYEITKNGDQYIFVNEYSVNAKPGDCEPLNMFSLPYSSMFRRTYILVKIPDQQ